MVSTWKANCASWCGFCGSGAQSPPSTTTASPYLIFVLSIKLARRASPPLGVCQPQGVM
jgi:hypothetical protein